VLGVVRFADADCGDVQGVMADAKAMKTDTHKMLEIMESMQADMLAKTAWIPRNVKAPAWLAGKQ
jgi:hypothetical protein